MKHFSLHPAWVLLMAAGRRYPAATAFFFQANSDASPYHPTKIHKRDNDVPQEPEGLHVLHNVISEDTWKILRHWLEHDEFLFVPSSNNNIINNNKNNKNTTSTRITSPIPWERGVPQDRRVAQFGVRYNYETSVVKYADDVPEIPPPLRQLLLESLCTREPSLRSMFHESIDANHNNNNNRKKDKDPLAFTQCIINVYQAEDSIPWHWDHVDFGPTVLVFTFGEDRPLRMRRLLQKNAADTMMAYPRSQCHHNEDKAEQDFQYYTLTPNHGSCYILSGPARYEWEHSVPKGSGFRVSITFRTHCMDDNDTAGDI